MCYTLNAEKIILNFFAKSSRDSISFKQLNEISSKIVRECNNGVIVVLNRDSIENAVLSRSSILSINEESVELIDRNNSIVRNIDIINRNIPRSISSKCIAICEAYGKKR